MAWAFFREVGLARARRRSSLRRRRSALNSHARCDMRRARAKLSCASTRDGCAQRSAILGPVSAMTRRSRRCSAAMRAALSRRPARREVRVGGLRRRCSRQIAGRWRRPRTMTLTATDSAAPKTVTLAIDDDIITYTVVIVSSARIDTYMYHRSYYVIYLYSPSAAYIDYRPPCDACLMILES